MILRAQRVLPIAAEPIEDGGVLVRGSRIRDVGPFARVAAAHPEERVRDLGAAMLLPGFVNVHSHLELTILRGFLDGLSLFSWLQRLLTLKADVLEPNEYVFYSLLGAAEMLRAGTTCVGDCSETGAPADALAVSGLRGTVFQEGFALRKEDVRASTRALGERLDALAALGNENVRIGLSPHSPYTACPSFLEATAQMAEDRSLPLSIHAAESPAEIAFLRDGTGPLAEHHRARGIPVEPTGRSPVEQLEVAGWFSLGVPVQLVHLTRATRTDIERISHARRVDGRAVGVAACPRSNARLGNGLPDLRSFETAGLCWGLGTDGAPAVGACDAFAEMRFAALVQSGSSARVEPDDDRRIVSRATLDAAESLGVGDEVGSLEAGKAADLVAVDTTSIRFEPGGDPFSALVHCATPDDVVLTMVAGEILFDGKEVLRVDEERVRARCRERADVIARMTG